MCKQYGYIYTSELSSAALYTVKQVDSGAILTQTSQCDTNDCQAWFRRGHIAGTIPHTHAVCRQANCLGRVTQFFADMHTTHYQLTSMPRIVPRHVLFASINIAFEHSIFILLYGHARHFRHFLKHLLLNVCTTFSLRLLLQLCSTLKRQL